LRCPRFRRGIFLWDIEVAADHVAASIEGNNDFLSKWSLELVIGNGIAGALANDDAGSVVLVGRNKNAFFLLFLGKPLK
jgi:hypothetical protein